MNTTKSFIMNSKESLKYQIIQKYLCNKLYRAEAAQLLNVSERTIARYAKKIGKLGPHGVKNGNFGRIPNSAKYSVELKQRVLEIYLKSYFDFNLKHFSELLLKEHGLDIKYQTLWVWFRDLRLIKNPRRRRPRKHVYRTRLPQEGLLLVARERSLDSLSALARSLAFSSFLLTHLRLKDESNDRSAQSKIA